MPLVARAALAGTQVSTNETIAGAVQSLAHRIDPFVELKEGAPRTIRAAIDIGSPDCPNRPWYIGANANLVSLGVNPHPPGDGDGFSLGTGLARCVAASVLLKQAARMAVHPIAASAWTLQEGPDDGGPNVLPALDVG